MASPNARPLRADARQSIARILEGAVRCLGRDPGASMGEIAAAAGVGRATLYAHFPTRADVVAAALAQALRDGESVLEEVDLTGHPTSALRDLIGSSWVAMEQTGALLEAAQAVLSPDRIRELHGGAADRVEALLRRGQAEGAFRADLPVSWMAGVLHQVMKGAAVEVRAGRCREADAPRLITATVLAAFAGAAGREPAAAR